MISFIAWLFFFAAGAQASNNFTRLHLPEGLSLEIPKNWSVMSGNNIITLSSWVEANLENSALRDIENKVPFWAQYFLDSGESAASVITRFYPALTMTDDEAIRGGAAFIEDLDRNIKTDFAKGLVASGGRLVKWQGTRKQDIAGINYFVSEMDFFAQGKDQHGLLVRRIDAGDSFTVIVTYSKKLEFYLQPISEKIVRSIRTY